MAKTRLKGRVKDFGVNYNAIDTGDILDIHRYFKQKNMI